MSTYLHLTDANGCFLELPLPLRDLITECVNMLRGFSNTHFVVTEVKHLLELHFDVDVMEQDECWEHALKKAKRHPAFQFEQFCQERLELWLSNEGQQLLGLAIKRCAARNGYPDPWADTFPHEFDFPEPTVPCLPSRNTHNEL